jgi:threonine dehydratase
MQCRRWHARGSAVQFDDQGQPRCGNIGQAHNPQSAHLQQSGQCRHWPRDAIRNIHAIISHQIEAARKQPQHQVGLARTRWSDQQHALPRAAGAAPVDLHDHTIWPETRRKESDLSPGKGRASVRSAMVSRSDIASAAARIAGYIRHTPLLCLAGAELGLGFAVTLKLEFLQHTGSFKPRGAFNRLLSAQLPKAGVIAASGGNHGAAVAYAARALGVTAEIFVPARTPPLKVARIASYGARIVQTGATYADALVASRDRQSETGALEVHAYDHRDVLAGQGTVGREFEHDAPDLTHILVATGGGGLIGGIAAWYAGSATVVSVEPEGCPTLHNALKAGQPVEVAVGGLAADSLGARQVGNQMFPIAQAHVAAAVLVPDAAIAAAQRMIWDRLRLVAEPGGATALAALLCGAFAPPTDASVGVLLCGANTDPSRVVEP